MTRSIGGRLALARGQLLAGVIVLSIVVIHASHGVSRVAISRTGPKVVTGRRAKELFERWLSHLRGLSGEKDIEGSLESLVGVGCHWD